MDILHADALLAVFAILGPGYRKLLASVCTKWQTAITLTPTPTLTAVDVAELMLHYPEPEKYLPTPIIDNYVQYLNDFRTDFDTQGFLNNYLYWTTEDAIEGARIVAIFLFNGDLKKIRSMYLGAHVGWCISWDPPPAISEAVEGSADHPDAAVLTTSPSPTPQ
jgi:hypothetical protein